MVVCTAVLVSTLTQLFYLERSRSAREVSRGSLAVGLLVAVLLTVVRSRGSMIHPRLLAAACVGAFAAWGLCLVRLMPSPSVPSVLRFPDHERGWTRRGGDAGSGPRPEHGESASLWERPRTQGGGHEPGSGVRTEATALAWAGAVLHGTALVVALGWDHLLQWVVP